MTNRLLHTDGYGTTLEYTDTTGRPVLTVTVAQGPVTTATSVDIPAHLANGLLAAAPVFGVPTTFAPTNHKFDWEKRQTIDPKLLRDALTVALWGEDNTDASVAADRAATVVERLLDPGNQVQPWTPSYAVGILKAKVDENAADPAPHAEAAARGVLGLPFPEDAKQEIKQEGATVGFGWQTPTDLHRFKSPFGAVRPVPGPVHYGSPWDAPFDEAARAKAAEIAANDATDENLIPVDVVDEDETPLFPETVYDRQGAAKPEKEDKVKKDKVKKDKPGKGRPDKPGKPDHAGGGPGRRMGVLRYIVDHLDGDMEFPGGPKSPALRFYGKSLGDVENFIEEHTVDALIYDPRGEAPSLGHGTTLDGLDDAELLALAAAVGATSFEQEPREPGAWFPSLSEAVKATLHAIYVDVWSVVAHALSEDELVVGEDGKIELPEPDEDEPGEDEEEVLAGQ